MEDDFEVEMSPMSGQLTESGKSVTVDIYRGENEGWILEIVDEFDNSTVWEDEFSSDAEAIKEARAAIEAEGIDAFIGMNTE